MNDKICTLSCLTGELKDIFAICKNAVKCCTQTLKKAFVSAFYRYKRRLFADSEESGHCSLHSNIYAAYFGLYPDDANGFADLMEDTDRFCGAFPMYFAMRALAESGRYDVLWRVLTRNDEHGWRNMLREGATACFEVWGKDQKWNTSLCHAWSSSPISIIIEEIAGFKPRPGTASGYEFSPYIPDDIPYFELQIPFRGFIYSVRKYAGRSAVLERKNNYAVPENE